MPRPTTASKCGTEIRVQTPAGSTIGVCARAEHHPGPHRIIIEVPPRVAAPR